MEVKLAKGRKIVGIGKTGGTKALLAMPLPTLAELAAARGVSAETFLAEIRSAFAIHGETADDGMSKEFRPWLIRFALALCESKVRFEAWCELKSKCDVLQLLQELYLFTCFGKTSANVRQDACRFLKKELDKLIPKYGRVHKNASTLFNHPKLRLLTAMSKGLSQIFEEQRHSFAMLQQTLEFLRAFAKQTGSYKADARTFHLYGMAAIVSDTQEMRFGMSVGGQGILRQAEHGQHQEEKK